MLGVAEVTCCAILAHLSGIYQAILGLMLGPCWVLLGRLGHYVAPSWDYVERRKDKVQKLQL